jgi:hypothetical protein
MVEMMQPLLKAQSDICFFVLGYGRVHVIVQTACSK